jgi:hypothetical protein
MRLANWCQSHGLKKEAIDEAQTAVEIRPGHAPSKRLLENLQRVQAISHGAEAARKPAKEDGTNNAPAVNNDSLSLFVTRVQPILMNACASCHATGRGGSFKLSRTFDAGLANRKATSQNLAAVLANVSTEQPLLSRFLTMAVSVHGTMPQSPLRCRDSPAYHTLEDWVRKTVETNPQLAGKPAGVATAVPPPQAAPAILEATRQTPTEFAQLMSDQARTNTKPATTDSQTAVAGPVKESSTSAASSETGGATREPIDAFDPLIFNRQMHPPQKPDGSRQ